MDGGHDARSSRFRAGYVRRCRSRTTRFRVSRTRVRDLSALIETVADPEPLPQHWSRHRLESRECQAAVGPKSLAGGDHRHGGPESVPLGWIFNVRIKNPFHCCQFRLTVPVFARSGCISVLDVSTTPWRVIKHWQAHQGKVTKISLDPASVWSVSGSKSFHWSQSVDLIASGGVPASRQCRRRQHDPFLGRLPSK